MAIGNDTSMPQWYRDAMEQQQRQQEPPAAPAHPLVGMTPEKLDALGLSQAWAGKSAEWFAEMERQQRRRDIAGRLGVDVRFLPEGIEDGD